MMTAISTWQAFDWFWFGVAVALLFSVYTNRAAYYNGANDGYGYAMDPGCPGYFKAGRYLRKYLRHRFPEVMRGAHHDPEA